MTTLLSQSACWTPGSEDEFVAGDLDQRDEFKQEFERASVVLFRLAVAGLDQSTHQLRVTVLQAIFERGTVNLHTGGTANIGQLP